MPNHRLRLSSTLLFMLITGIANADVGILEINPSNIKRWAKERFSVSLSEPKAGKVEFSVLVAADADFVKFLRADLDWFAGEKHVMRVRVQPEELKSGSRRIGFWLAPAAKMRCVLSLLFDKTKPGQPDVGTSYRIDVNSFLSDATDRGAASVIAGTWESNWGPMRIKATLAADMRGFEISGSWKQGEGMTGIIESGRFDPKTGLLEFEFDEPWHDRSGRARLQRSPDGKSFDGTWTFHRGGGGGNWSLRRNKAAIME